LWWFLAVGGPLWLLVIEGADSSPPLFDIYLLELAGRAQVFFRPLIHT